MRGPTKGSNQKKMDNNNLALPCGGGLERGSPAMTAKRLRKGVEETHNINVVGNRNSDDEVYESDQMSLLHVMCQFLCVMRY